jgi:hypothetical protein
MILSSHTHQNAQVVPAVGQRHGHCRAAVPSSPPKRRVTVTPSSPSRASAAYCRARGSHCPAFSVRSGTSGAQLRQKGEAPPSGRQPKEHLAEQLVLSRAVRSLPAPSAQ